MKLLLTAVTLLGLFASPASAENRKLYRFPAHGGTVWETRDYKKAKALTFLANAESKDREVKKASDFEVLPKPKEDKTPPAKPKVETPYVQYVYPPVAYPVQTYSNIGPGYIYATPPGPQQFIVPRRNGIHRRRLILGPCFGAGDYSGHTGTVVAPVMAAPVTTALPVKKEDDALARCIKAADAWLSEQLAVAQVKGAEYYNTGKEYVQAHPYETATGVLAVLLVLVIRHYRRKVRNLHRMLTSERVSVAVLKSTHCRANCEEACHADCETACQMPGPDVAVAAQCPGLCKTMPPPAQAADDYDGDYEFGEQLFRDMVGEMRQAHEQANERTQRAFEVALNSVNATNAASLKALQVAQDTMIEVLKATQDTTAVDIRNAFNKASDITQSAANNAISTASKAAELAENKVVELTKLALEAVKAAATEHSKAETATVNALSAVAQKSVDSTKAVLDSLTERTDK